MQPARKLKQNLSLVEVQTQKKRDIFDILDPVMDRVVLVILVLFIVYLAAHVAVAILSGRLPCATW